MAVVGFKRDTKGLGQILKSNGVARAVHILAERTMNNAQGTWPDADMVVDDYVTDRVASSVTIREADARLREVKEGILSRAAARAGLEVTERR